MSVPHAGSAWQLPATQPTARRHWWSIQPAPEVPAISARRAYAEVIGVFAAFFAASILAGAESLARRYPAPSGSWAVFTPAAIGELAMAGLAIVLVVLLSSRRGISTRSLGFGLPRKANGKAAAAQTFRMGVWAVMALLAGALITSALATGKLRQPAVQDTSYVIYATAASLAAGVIEETVVLAFVVSTLRQARRPLPEIVIVALLLRCSYHDYYGPGVIGIAAWAAVFVWLYLRFASVVPLIVVHFLWDASLFIGQQHGLKQSVAVGQLAAFLLLPIAAGITWLVDVLHRPSQGRGRGGGWPGGGWAGGGAPFTGVGQRAWQQQGPPGGWQGRPQPGPHGGQPAGHYHGAPPPPYGGPPSSADGPPPPPPAPYGGPLPPRPPTYGGPPSSTHGPRSSSDGPPSSTDGPPASAQDQATPPSTDTSDQAWPPPG